MSYGESPNMAFMISLFFTGKLEIIAIDLAIKTSVAPGTLYCNWNWYIHARGELAIIIILKSKEKKKLK